MRAIRRAWVMAWALAGCTGLPSAELETPPPVTATPTPSEPEPSDSAPSEPAPSEPDPNRLALRFHSLRGADTTTYTTADLHAAKPSAAYAIVVHTPSTDDSRFFRHEMTIDALFHPHDPAPDVVHLFSSPSQRLESPAGRVAHQLEPAASAQLQARVGEFAVLVLDAEGRVLLESREPVGRERIHEAIGHRDRKPAPKPPPPRP